MKTYELFLCFLPFSVLAISLCFQVGYCSYKTHAFMYIDEAVGETAGK